MHIKQIEAELAACKSAHAHNLAMDVSYMWCFEQPNLAANLINHQTDEIKRLNQQLAMFEDALDRLARLYTHQIHSAEGYVLVPAKPTAAILLEGQDAGSICGKRLVRIYKAMIEAKRNEP